MAKWSTEQIKSLRLRLGWSAADFARRFGCTSETVLAWELGQSQPTADDLRQLDRLVFYLETYSERLAHEPIAEVYLQTAGLNQVHHEQVPRKPEN